MDIYRWIIPEIACAAFPYIICFELINNFKAFQTVTLLVEKLFALQQNNVT